jgi:hypothetical protein
MRSIVYPFAIHATSHYKEKENRYERFRKA